MSVADSILNLAALLLWLTWRGIGTVEPAGAAGTILGNLRPAETRVQRRWTYLVALGALLLVRALFYRQLGPSMLWHPVWDNGIIPVPFRSDLFLRVFAYSLLSFGWILYTWYAWLILIAVVNHPPHDRDGVTRQVRRSLGGLVTWPGLILLILPMPFLSVAWVGVGWLATHFEMLPPLRDFNHLVQQAFLVGLGGFLVWRWLLVVVYILYFINNYVYLGRHPFWEFIQNFGARICRPFAWIQMGRLDLSPLLGLIVVWLAFSLPVSGWPWLKDWNLPFTPPEWVLSGILPAAFRTLPWPW